MASRNVAVVDFGTSTLTVLIGDRSVNGTFEVKGYSEVEYAGFLEGEILEPEKLAESLSLAINSAQNNARCKITHLFVGVPAEFSIAKVCNVEKIYGKKKRIGFKEIDDLFVLADEFGSNPTHIVVNRSPICFVLDNGDRLIDPKGELTSSLGASLSFILAESRFVGFVYQALASLKIKYVEFISEPLAESLYLIEPEERDRCAILVDCGYLSTSVSVMVGDGLVGLKSFALGGGHIEADLVEFLQIPFGVAKELKKVAFLTGQPSENEKLNFTVNGENYQFDALAVYEIVQRKIRQIARMISKSLESCNYEMPIYIALNLTGGGISYIKGVTDSLKEYLGKDVFVLQPKITQMNEPKNSAVLGLLDLALKQNIGNTFFIKIFKK